MKCRLIPSHGLEPATSCARASQFSNAAWVKQGQGHGERAQYACICRACMEGCAPPAQPTGPCTDARDMAMPSSSRHWAVLRQEAADWSTDLHMLSWGLSLGGLAILSAACLVSFGTPPAFQTHSVDVLQHYHSPALHSDVCPVFLCRPAACAQHKIARLIWWSPE